MNLVVEGTVVTAILRKDSRKQERVIHRSVEVHPVVFGSTLNPDLAESFIPNPPTISLNSFEVPIWNFSLKVVSCLINANERSADLDLDLFTLSRRKTRIPADPVALLLSLTVNGGCRPPMFLKTRKAC